MRRLVLSLLVPATVAALGLSAPASAAPSLVSSTPAPKGSAVKPTRLTLTFSEPVVADLSGVELTMTGMPGMANHAPMAIRGFETAVTGATLIVTMPRALPAGTYVLRWRAAGADRGVARGEYAFTVR